MIITQNVYKKILTAYPVPPPEQGGILGIKDGIVCEYFHDGSRGNTHRAVYEPDTELLNRVIGNWADNGICFAGIVHSHIAGQETLSADDSEYINVIFNAMPEDITELYFPIIIPEKNALISYSTQREKQTVVIRPDDVQIIESEGGEKYD